MHDPYLPTVLICDPDLTVRRVYDGYWTWGRPSLHELWPTCVPRPPRSGPTGRRPVPELGWLALLDEPRPGSVPVGTGAHLLLRVGRASRSGRPCASSPP